MGAPRQLITPLLWTSVSYLISTATADTGCFNPNGTDRNLGALDVPSGTNVYAPCNTVQPYSMCCRNSDKCLPNGLCQQAGSDIIWRESCSDQSWRSSACVKLCVSDTGMRSIDHPVHQCPDQSWCCAGGPSSANATSCCEQGLGAWLVDGQVTNVNPNSTSTTTSSSSQTSTPKTSTSSTSTPSAAGAVTSPAGVQASPNTYGGGGGGGGGGGASHTGAIAGGVVGGVVALAVLLGGAWFLLRRRRRSRTGDGGIRTQVPQMGYHEAGPGVAEERVPYQYQMEKAGVQEVAGDGIPREELDGRGVRRELGGAGVGR